MKKWQCSKCGKENSQQVTFCPCSVKDGKLIVDESQQTGTSISDSRSSWRYSYSRWMLVVISIVFMLRKTTDGLWFIAFATYAVAKRFEERKKYGSHILYGRKENESIWQYGVGRTLTALIAPSFLKGYPSHEQPFFNAPRFVTRLIVTICALHLYIGVVGLLDTINPEGIAELLTIINKPFSHLLGQWPAYLDCAEEFIIHGYAYRLPLLNHLYITCTFGALLFVWFTLLEICDGDLEGRYNKHNEQMASVSPLRSGYLEKCRAALTRCYPARIVLIYLCTVGLFYFFKYAPSLLLHFPGEAYARHGKYAWMASAAYRDNIGFFTPIYLFLPLFTLLCTTTTFAFEPLYRTMLYIKRFLKKLLV